MQQNGETNRNKQGVIVGIIGLVLNLLLGVAKLVIGIFSASVSMISDAVNNIMDGFSSCITSASFYLASRKADDEHPFGHGRYEYIASFVIAVMIIFVGFQFILESVDKMINPQTLNFSHIAVIILIASIVIKLAMGSFYAYKSKQLNSSALKASAFDSFFDCLITGVVLVSLLVFNFTGINIDAYCSFAVSIVIIISGINLVRQTIDQLLGGEVDKKLTGRIKEIVLSNASIVGIHELNIHEYGPEKRLASIHCELDGKLSMAQAHEIIDGIEDDVEILTGVEIVIHCDPVVIASKINDRINKK